MGLWALGWPELPPDIYLPEDVRDEHRRCKHGMRLPHPCRECEAESTPEGIAAFMAAEGLAPNARLTG